MVGVSAKRSHRVPLSGAPAVMLGAIGAASLCAAQRRPSHRLSPSRRAEGCRERFVRRVDAAWRLGGRAARPSPRALAGSLSRVRRFAQPRVAAAGKSLVGGDGREQLDQLTAACLRQAGADVELMRPGYGHDHVESLPSPAGQPQGVSPSVARVGSPFQQPALLQLVDDPDDLARWHGKRRRQRCLRSTFLRADMTQDEDRSGIEPNRRETVMPPSRRMRAHLGKQVGGARHTERSGGGATSLRFGAAHLLGVWII
jgi:hypothetical protein